MELMQTINLLMEVNEQLTQSRSQLRLLAENKAISEANYRRELAKRILELRTEKLPVSIISDIARGELWELKLLRDKDEAMYKAEQDSLSALQSQARILTQIHTWSEYIETTHHQKKEFYY